MMLKSFIILSIEYQANVKCNLIAISIDSNCRNSPKWNICRHTKKSPAILAVTLKALPYQPAKHAFSHSRICVRV